MSSSSSPLPLGLIVGSSFLSSPWFQSYFTLQLNVKDCLLYTNASHSIFVAQRHATHPQHEYSPPHLIRYDSIIGALHSIGVHRILSFGSVGSLRPSLPIGSIVLIDDFFDPTFTANTKFAYEKDGHVAPWPRGEGSVHRAFMGEVKGIIEESRRHPPSSADEMDLFMRPFLWSGVYTQSVGPRFETKSEIRFLAEYGDVVGMTAAHEASLSNEVDIPFALLCCIDNMANGVAQKDISFEEFHLGVKANQKAMDTLLRLVVTHFEKKQHGDSSGSVDFGARSDIIKWVKQFSPSSTVPSSPSKTPVDLIIHSSHIIPVVPSHVVLHDHCVVINGGKIVDIKPRDAILTSIYSAGRFESHNESALMPGFVNSHTHVGMTLLRGYADDYCLHSWLSDHIWPVEAKFLCPEYVRDSTFLAIAEMLRCGTTCFNDMYFFSEVIADVVDKTGMRGVIGATLLEFPTPYAKTVDEYIELGMKLRKPYVGHPRLQFTLSPHAPYTVSDATWKRVKEVQKEIRNSPSLRSTGTRICSHIHETKAEVDESSKPPTNAYSLSRHLSQSVCRPLKNLDSMQILDEEFICVHMTQIDDGDLDILRSRHPSVVHCPSSNMKLGSGFCPTHRLNANGITVGVGTDSSASNNSLDMWTEMKMAALLSKGFTGDAEALSANDALRMATINGATAIGLQQSIGSIEVGKLADLQLVSLDSLELSPMYDIIPHLVYAGSSRHVTNVWVHGVKLMENRKLLTIDEKELKGRIGKWQKDIGEFRDVRNNQLKKKATNNPSN